MSVPIPLLRLLVYYFLASSNYNIYCHSAQPGVTLETIFRVKNTGGFHTGKTIYNAAYIKVVEELRIARRNRGMRQEDAGRRMGVSRHWIRKVETCELRLDLVQFVRLCRLYRLDAIRLMRRVAEESPEEGDPPLPISYRSCGAQVVPAIPCLGACFNARWNSCYAEFGKDPREAASGPIPVPMGGYRDKTLQMNGLRGWQGELRRQVERAMGIEPTWPAWKAGVLPLNYARSKTSGEGSL